jgi:hypothetical protein
VPPITIDAANGERVIYEYERGYATNTAEDLQFIPSIKYMAVVENNEFLWEIELFGIIDRSGQAQADFEHIVNTFKFID